MPQSITEVRSTTGTESQTESLTSNRNTPDLVSKVADQVYEMLLRDMRIDFERGRSTLGVGRQFRGGR